MLLPSVRLDLLLEVSVLIERTDADKRNSEVACGLAVITGKHAEAARVNPQAFVKTKFRGKINKRSALVPGMVLREPRLIERFHIRLEFAQHRLVHAEEHLILQQRFPVGRLD